MGPARKQRRGTRWNPGFRFQRRDEAAIEGGKCDYADISRRCARGSRMLETLLRKFSHPLS